MARRVKRMERVVALTKRGGPSVSIVFIYLFL